MDGTRKVVPSNLEFLVENAQFGFRNDQFSIEILIFETETFQIKALK